jgi:hypothetical protein
MLILKRKTDAPIYTDSTGCEQPNMVIALLAPIEDKRNKVLELNIAYFHSLQAYYDGRDFLPKMPNICMRFKEDYSVPAKYDDDGNLLELGWSKYSDVKKTITISEDGELVITDDSVKYWFLNQTFAFDFEGKLFADNWDWI